MKNVANPELERSLECTVHSVQQAARSIGFGSGKEEDEIAGNYSGPCHCCIVSICLIEYT